MSKRPLVACFLLLLSVFAHGQAPEVYAPAHSWGLVLGASKYTKLAPLKYAAKDALLFSKVLVNDLGFDPRTVTTLTDDKGDEDKLNSKNVLAALDKLIHDRRQDPGHLFVFYFSGHGIGTPQGDYLCPTDADAASVTQVGVPVKEVVKRFVDAGMHNVLFIADACREGEKNPFGKELRELARTARLAVMLGCLPGQRSYENPRVGHGYFSSALASAINDKRLSDKKFGALWASTVASDVVRRVSTTTELQFGDAKQVPSMWTNEFQDILLAVSPPPPGSQDGEVAALLQTAKGKGQEAYVNLLRGLMSCYFLQREFVKAVEVASTLEGLGALLTADRGCLLGAYKFLGREREAQTLCAQMVRSCPDGYYRDQAILWWSDSSVTSSMRRDASKRIWETERDFASADTYFNRVAYIDPADEAEVFGLADSLIQHFGEKSRQGLFLSARLALYAKDEKRAAALLKEARAATGAVPAEKVMLDLEFELLLKQKDYDGMMSVAMRGIEVDIVDRWLLNLTIGFKSAPLEKRKNVARLAIKYATFGPNYLKAVSLLRSDAYLLIDDISKVAKENPSSIYAQSALMLAKATESFALPLVMPPALEKVWTGDLTMAGYLYGGIYEAAEEARRKNRIDQVTYERISSAALMPFLERGSELVNGPLPVSYCFLLCRARPTTGQGRILMERWLSGYMLDKESNTYIRKLWFHAICETGQFDLAGKALDAGGWGDDLDDMTVRYAIARGMSGSWGDGIDRFNTIKKPDSTEVRHQMWALAHYSRILKGIDEKPEDLQQNGDKVTDPMAKRLVWIARTALALGVKETDKKDFNALTKLLPKARDMMDPHARDVTSRVLKLAWRAQAALVPETVKREEYVLWSADAREGSPLFDALPWSVPSKVDDFKGTTVLAGTALYDGEAKPVDAKVSFEVASDGNVSVHIERHGQAPVDLKGSIGPYGAFRVGDGKLVATGRLMPPGLAKLRPDIAREGVRMALWDEKCAQWTFALDVPR